MLLIVYQHVQVIIMREGQFLERVIVLFLLSGAHLGLLPGVVNPDGIFLGHIQL